jgi:hypothetical protein
MLWHVPWSREYLAGDRVQLLVLREGKRLALPLVLSR